MDTVIITPKTKEDINLLKALAKKMGLAVKVVSSAGKKEAALNEIRKNLQQAFKEVELIESGKAKGLTPEELLNELK